MQIKPLYDRVVIRRLAAETTTKSGIVIPDTATEKPTQGEVLAAGPGTKLRNGDTQSLSVKKGDRVLLGQYAGSEFKHQGETLVIVRESDILAVIEPATAKEKVA